MTTRHLRNHRPKRAVALVRDSGPWDPLVLVIMAGVKGQIAQVNLFLSFSPI